MVRRTTKGPWYSGSTLHPSPHVSASAAWFNAICVGDSKIILSDAALVCRRGKNLRTNSSSAVNVGDASWVVELGLEACRSGELRLPSRE